MRIQFLIILLCYLGRNSLISADEADEFYFDGDGEGGDGGSLTGSEYQELELAAVEMNHPYSETVRRPNFSFEYGIDDDDRDHERPKSRTHKHSNDGRKVQGQYRVLQPDGMVKVVEYRTDPQTGNIKTTIEYNHA